MMVFNAEAYRERSGRCCGTCGPEFEASEIVIADSKDEAMEFLLADYPESFASDWEIENVETDIKGVVRK
jgi:hypothetical protein